MSSDWEMKGNINYLIEEKLINLSNAQKNLDNKLKEQLND
jgi:hypothetical protein